jgi:hypothetical protein
MTGLEPAGRLAEEDRLKLARAIVRRAIQEAVEATLHEGGLNLAGNARSSLLAEMVTARVLDSLERPALRNAVEILGLPGTKE